MPHKEEVRKEGGLGIKRSILLHSHTGRNDTAEKEMTLPGATKANSKVDLSPILVRLLVANS